MPDPIARRSLAQVAALESRRLLAATLVADLSPTGVNPTGIVANGGSIAYFTGKTATSGRELWRTDGTTAGTRMVIDLAPGSADSSPQNLTIAGRYAYFSINAVGSLRAGLYRSDGTSKGTVRLLDLVDADDFRGAADVGKNSVIFGLNYYGENGWGLWRSDGTTKGTRELVDGGLADFGTTAANAVGNPSTGEYLSLGDDTTQSPVFSDGTAKGTHAIELGAKRYSLATSAGKTIYLTGEFDKSYKVFRLDRAGKLTQVAEALAVGFGSDASADYAFGVTFDKTKAGTFARYDGGTVQSYALYDAKGKRGAIPYDVDNLFFGGHGDQGLFVDARSDSSAGVWLTHDDDHSLRRLGTAPIDEVHGAVSNGDSAYVIGTPAAGDDEYELARIDAKTGKSSTVLSSSVRPDGYDDESVQAFGEVNGHEILRWADNTGANELYAIDVKSHRPERLTGGAGSAKDSIVYAYANDAAGRTLVLSGHAEAKTVSVDLVNADGSVHNLHVETVDNVARVYAGAAALAGSVAYVSFEADVKLERRTFLFGIDVETGTVETLRKDYTDGELLTTTAAGRAYFNVGSQLQTSAGTSASTHAIGKTAPYADEAVAVGERIVYVGGGSLYGASPDGAKVETLRRAADTAGSIISHVVLAGGDAFAAHGGTLYRTDGTAAGTTAVAASQFPGSRGKIESVIASHDGQSIYALFAGDATHPWTIARLAADGSSPATTILAKPATWNGDDPTLIAAGGDDVVLGTGTFFVDGSNASKVTTYALRISRGTIAQLTYAGAGFDPRGVIATDDAVLLTSVGSGQNVVRLKAGGLRPLVGLANAELSLRYDRGSVYSSMSTKATGKELFRYRLDTTVVGAIYGDLNANQSRETSERGLAGWRVYVDSNDNGRWDKGEPNVLTDTTGRFEFFELGPGTYKLRVSTGSKYAMTTGTAYTVKPAAGQTVTKKFGARPIA